MGIQDIFLNNECNRLLDRLEKVLKKESGSFFEEFGLEKLLGYPTKLIYSIPKFVIYILNKVSDKDIYMATRAVLFGISHCPNCSNQILPSTTKCPQCNTAIPKDSVYIKNLNVLNVDTVTKELLRTILCTKISIDGVTKDLQILPAKSAIPEIITSLSHEVRICPDCGFQITPFNAKYCWNCGSKLASLPAVEVDPNITISLPVNDDVIAEIHKIAIRILHDISELDYIEQVIIQDFCDTLIENKIASAKLCKKVGTLFANLEEYETAIHYYQVAMDIDSSVDLTAQIERMEKKLYSY